MSTLGAQRTRVTHLSVPEMGQWRADVTLESGALPSGTLTLTIADLALVGTVERAGYDAPEAPHAVVVGGIGWDREITRSAARALSLYSDAGVRLSSVLRALAAQAGETIAQPTDRTIGQHWSAISSGTGEGVRYRDVLTRLVREGLIATWWVDANGTTRFTTRPETTPRSRATFLRGNGGVGLRVYGVDSPGDFLPGAVVDGTPVGRAVVVDTPESLTVECWERAAPTVRDHVTRIVASAFPAILYGYPRTYVVDAVNADSTLDLVPPPTSPALRELRSVAQWNTGGAIVTPRLGAEVLVAFRDADDRAPVVVAWAPGVPLELSLDGEDLVEVGPTADAVELAGGGEAVHRVGDTGSAGTLTLASVPNPPGPPGVIISYTPPGGAPTVVCTLTGAITIAPDPATVDLDTVAETGSPKVTSG